MRLRLRLRLRLLAAHPESRLREGQREEREGQRKKGRDKRVEREGLREELLRGACLLRGDEDASYATLRGAARPERDKVSINKCK